MKPALLKRYLSLLVVPIIFIFAFAFFLLITPHLTKPAHAQLAQSCAVASSTVQQGGSIGLAYQGVAAGYQIFIWDGGSNRYNYSSNTVDSTTAQQWISIPIPANAAPGNNYYGFIGTPSPMTCKTTGGTAFSITASSGCTYNFSPTTVAAGQTVTVNIVTAGANDSMSGGISDNGNPSVTGSRVGIGTFTVTAPTPVSGHTYLVYAIDSTTGGNLCALTGGSSTLTINPSSGSCTYSFSPTTVPAGQTVTVTISGPSNYAAFIRDTTTSTNVASGSGTGTITLTAPTPNGSDSYIVYAIDQNTTSLCALAKGSTTLTINGGGGNYAVLAAIPGCTSGLNCFVGVAYNITATTYTFDSSNSSITKNTNYSVVVCNVDCSSPSNYLPGWNPPQNCQSNDIGKLVVDWTGGKTFCNNAQAVTCTSADVNKDGSIGVDDIQAVAAAFGKTASSPGWNPALDVIPDGVINQADVNFVTNCFNQQPINVPPVYSCKSFFTCLSGIATPNLKYTQPQGIIGTFLSDILPSILILAGFLTVIIIIISGIQFVISSGDPERAAKARSRLIFALVGFVVIILAFAFVKIIDMLFLGSTGII